jgi:hypothetical protein
MVEGVTTLTAVLVAVTVGARATRTTRTGEGSAPGTAPRPKYRVTWDPPTHVTRRTPGPLVYIVREWAGDEPQPEVKIGWTGRDGRGAAAGRIGEWETGTRYPVRVEALIPLAPQTLERALHRALAGDRTSTKREWFTAPRDDTVWRGIVEATAAAHKE